MIRLLKTRRAAFVGLGVLLLISLFEWSAVIFEESMLRHMLIQIPALIAAGFVVFRLSPGLRRVFRLLDPSGVASVILATGWLLFWMVPLSLDLALIEPAMRVLKVITLTLGVGAALSWAWQAFGLIPRIVLLMEAWAGVTRLGWVYMVSPQQLCANYLVSDQQQVGEYLLVLSGMSAVVLLALALCKGINSTETTMP